MAASAFDFDVAIVGAGASGAYCAYRLMQRGDVRVGLFEASDRIGGRIHSASIGAPLPVELGAAFISDLHHNTVSLAGHLGLELTPLTWRRRKLYLQGREVRFAGLEAGADPLQLAAAEAGRTPEELLTHALDLIAPGWNEIWPLDRSANPDASRVKLDAIRFGGRPLAHWRFDDALAQVMSGRAVEIVRAFFGSRANFGAANALEAIRTLLGEMAPQRTFILRQGFDSLPKRLVAESGAIVHLRAELVALAPSEGGLVLHFGDGAEVKARQAILALPKLALRRLSIEAEAGALRQFEADLEQIGEVEACKLYFRFAKPWWEEVQSAPGHVSIAASYTDLPVQQCYFMSGDRPSVMLATFADEAGARQWLELHDRGGLSAVSKAALHDLRAMHAGSVIGEPEAMLWQAWREGASAAWHYWRAGCDGLAAAARLRAPHLGMPVFVCGEAVSDCHGWVEGALRSAVALLSDSFACEPAQGP